MRRMACLLIVATAVAPVAEAQRARGPGISRTDDGTAKRPRWGGHEQGRWWAGGRAPGGWGAYRRPVRGWVLPPYWVQPDWIIADWAGYGLPRPIRGHGWSRYYDDAVLIDSRGEVYDTIGGVDWDGVDADGVDYTWQDDGPVVAATRPGAPYAPPPRGGDRRTPVHDGHAPPALRHDPADVPPPGYHAPPPPIVTHQGNATVTTTTTSPGPGRYADGYYYPAPTVTTIMIQNQPTAGETTTYEDVRPVTKARPNRR